MTNPTPAYLQDSADLLSETGFKTSNQWYHGTASGLVNSIMESGLIPSGDLESIEKTLSAMKNIGVDYQGAPEPLYLTQSKELAYYWAQKKAEKRTKLFGEEESPVVIEITLEDEFLAAIKPDVGATTLLMAGDEYFNALEAIYTANNQSSKIEELKANPTGADRMDYLNLLGLAYSNQGIVKDCLKILSA